jgi:hypothetical protein
MGISASNLNLSNSNIFRNIPTPTANTAAISRGTVRNISPSPLAPSNTSYGTNANPALGGPTYISSAQVLAQQNAISTSNVVTTKNSVESGTQLQQALSTIAEQTPAPRFKSQTGIFSTEQTSNVQTQQTGRQSKEFSPVNIFSNVRTTSPIVEGGLALTGRNAGINAEGATNMAAVNARFNVQYSDAGSKALQGLHALAAQAAMGNVVATMDGKIPVTSALVNDFSLIEHTGTRGNRDVKIFDNITETFNRMLDGGGHGGGGGSLGRSDREAEPQPTPEEQDPKKGLNLMG